MFGDQRPGAPVGTGRIGGGDACGIHVGFGLVDPLLQRGRVQLRQQLALFDRLALADQHLRDALGTVEGKLHLADVDIAIQHKLIAVGAIAITEQMPCRGTGSRQQGNGNEDKQDFLAHCSAPGSNCDMIANEIDPAQAAPE